MKEGGETKWEMKDDGRKDDKTNKRCLKPGDASEGWKDEEIKKNEEGKRGVKLRCRGKEENERKGAGREGGGVEYLHVKGKE